MNISELIEQLQEIQEDHGDIEVRLASQPAWPLEFSIGGVVVADPSEGESEEGELEHDEVIAYIGEGNPLGYLPGFVNSILKESGDW